MRKLKGKAGDVIQSGRGLKKVKELGSRLPLGTTPPHTSTCRSEGRRGAGTPVADVLAAERPCLSREVGGGGGRHWGDAGGRWGDRNIIG